MTPAPRRGVDHRLADHHLAGLREVGDPRREVDRRAVVVALLEDDRTSVKADMRRRQSGFGDALDHLECRDHARPGVREMQHHAIAEPLDGPAAVLDRGSLDDPAELAGEFGRGRVTLFLGQAGVAGDVEEAHGRAGVRAGYAARPTPVLLDSVDDPGGPRARLLEAVHAEHRSLAEHGVAIAEVVARASRRAACLPRLPERSPRTTHMAASVSAIRRRLSPWVRTFCWMAAGRNPAWNCVSMRST